MKQVQRLIAGSEVLINTSVRFLPALMALLIFWPAVEANAQSPVCGSSLNDTAIHTPPNYTCSSAPCTSNPFPPPSGINQSITDPQYGCAITRLTTFGEFGSGLSTHHNYSTETPFNADSSKLLVINDSGQWAVIDRQGNVTVDVNNFPNNNDSSLVWDVSSASVFYITNSNQFIKATINGTNNVTTAVKHTFSGFTNVTIPDQTDISDDGCKIWLEADSGSGGTAVSYNLCTDTVNSQSLNIGPKDSGTAVPSWHKIQTFPSGKMLMTWNNQPTGQGAEVIFNTDGTLYWDPGFGNNSSHADVGTDLQNREVLLSSANGVNFGTPACSNLWTSINVFDINAKAVVACMIENIAPWHISYRDSSKGWVALSTFDMGACPDYSCFDTTPTNRLAANWQSIWPLYGEELLLVKVDGSAVYRLAHHRSRSLEAYYASPRAAISRDGKYIAWDSNFDISDTGQAQYADVYLTPNPISSSGSAFALVQKSAPGFVQASSQSTTFNSIGSGHLLIVCAYDNTDATVTTSISDTLGSAWSATTAITTTGGSGGPLTMRIFYAVAPTAGNDTITLSQSSGTAPLGGLYFEYSGNSSSNVLDMTASQAATGSTSSASSPNITTTGPHDLLVGFIGDTSGSGTITAGSGYTMQLTDVNFYTGAEDRLNVPVGTYSATATLPTGDAGWIAIVASFK